MLEATKSKKKANDSNAVMKYSSTEGIGKNPIYDYMVANVGNVGINIVEMPNKIGQLILIGTVQENMFRTSAHGHGPNN